MSFAPELNPGILHPDLQITFHGTDTRLLPGPDGSPLNCVKVESDTDYYRDIHELSDPTMAYSFRWIAARRAGHTPFNPLNTVE